MYLFRKFLVLILGATSDAFIKSVCGNYQLLLLDAFFIDKSNCSVYVRIPTSFGCSSWRRRDLQPSKHTITDWWVVSLRSTLQANERATTMITLSASSESRGVLHIIERLSRKMRTAWGFLRLKWVTVELIFTKMEIDFSDSTVPGTVGNIVKFTRPHNLTVMMCYHSSAALVLLNAVISNEWQLIKGDSKST